MPNSDPVLSREHLWKLLDERMRNTYDDLQSKQALESDSSLVKTYLLEAHLSEQERPKSVHAFLTSVLGKLGEHPPRVRPTDDASFFEIRSDYRGRVSLYIDASNPRFWVAHSVHDSRAVDALVERLSYSPQIDRAWLFADLLKRTRQLGIFRGLGLAFDRRRRAAGIPQNDEDQVLPVEFLKMQLWGNRAEDVLGLLEDKFPEATTLSKIKLKYSLSSDDHDDSAFTLDDIKFNGKITARGTSFQSHANLVASVYQRYSVSIINVEKKFRLRWTADERRLSMDGEPLNFVFPDPVRDLESLTENLFTGDKPFRLWGVPVRVSDQLFRVAAVDLHVGSRLRFELTPTCIRMYLLSHACGNTVVRFYTNLQHHYDARVEVLDGEDSPVFAEL